MIVWALFDSGNGCYKRSAIPKKLVDDIFKKILEYDQSANKEVV